MAIITDLASCSTNPTLNGPDGAVDLPSTLDDAIRYALSFIAQLRDGAGMPVGALLPFCSTSSAPLGYVKANGALLSRTTYAALFAFASAQGLVSEATWSATDSGRFSVGDGSTTFRVPDMRGVFLRGLDESRGVDPSRGPGTYQDHANAPHAHGVNDPSHAHGVSDPTHGHGGATDAQGVHAHNVFSQGGIQGASADPSFYVGNINANVFGGRNTSSDGNHAHNLTVYGAYTNIGIYGAYTGISIQSNGTEARPRNLAYPFFIKY